MSMRRRSARRCSRSENMRRIRSKDTRPELAVRKLLRELGFPGYRLHRQELPGKPDVVYVGRRKAIFVHGCFWHRHGCKVGLRIPKSNQVYWLRKIERNSQRDAAHRAALKKLGWQQLIVWECELKELGRLRLRINAFLEQRRT